MNKKILSIDVGTNSIGLAWVEISACSDNTKRINELKTLVSVFPEGVLNLGKGKKELSKNASRRDARSKRKVYTRKRWRKEKLLRCLIHHGMTPFETTEADEFEFETLVEANTFKQWMEANPYQLRAQALTTPLRPTELGRILYHLAQRRGYATIKGDKTDTSKLKEGVGNIAGFNDLEKHQAATPQKSTLGALLNTWLPKKAEPYRYQENKIRSRFVKQEEYKKELCLIWRAQATFEPRLAEALYDEIRNIIFYRRPLKRQKQLVGRCSFDTNKKRAPLSHPIFEAYRIESFIQHLRYKGKPLSKEECREARQIFFNQSELTLRRFSAKMGKDETLWNYERFIPAKLPLAKDTPKLEAILGKEYKDASLITKKSIWKSLTAYLDDEETRFKMIKEQYTPRKTDAELKAILESITFCRDKKINLSAPACTSIAKVLGKEKIEPSLDYLKEIEEVWQILYYEPKNSAEQLAARYPTRSTIEALIKLNIREGYSNLSRKVLFNALFFLREGHSSSIALTLAGVKNVFGEKRWHAFTDNNKNTLVQKVIKLFPQKASKREDFVSNSGPFNNLRKLLQQEYQVETKALNKLYVYHHHRAIGKRANNISLKNLFNDSIVKNLRNPLVEQTIFMIRKSVKAICQKYNTFPDKIHMELGRELKVGKFRRKEIRNNAIEQETIWKELRSTMETEGVKDKIAYRLLQDQRGICLYSGEPITTQDLKEGRLDIDHIWPKSRTLDNSYANKVLCLRSENISKANRIPYEYFQEREKSWEAFKARVAKLFAKNSAQYKRLTRKTLDNQGNIVSRQLNDMRYISRTVQKMLQPLVSTSISIIQGKITQLVRHKLGLNRLLEQSSKKIRTDYASQAVDAISIALTDYPLLQKLQTYYEKKETKRLSQSFDNKGRAQTIPYYDNLHTKAQQAIAQTLVYHHNSHRRIISKRNVTSFKEGKKHTNKSIAARGELHEENKYGLKSARFKEAPIESIKKLRDARKIFDDARECKLNSV